MNLGQSPTMELQRRPSRRSSDGGASKFLYKLLVACCVCFVVGWAIGRKAPWGDSYAKHSAAAALAKRTEELRKALGLPKLELPDVELAKGVYRCDDSCSSAKDGVCDDGRHVRSKGMPVKCDLGSDCTDCGGYNMLAHDSGKVGPIQRLLQGNPDMKLFARTTTTTPSFKMLYADPTKDLDVSANIDKAGLIESGITEVFRTILKEGCIERNTGARQLVLDVGANFGYYAVYAAIMGCRVIAWEPVPLFRSFLEYVLDLNKVAHLVTIRDRVVSDVDGQTLNMQVPSVGIWGTASVVDTPTADPSSYTAITATTERVDTVVGNQEVLLLKMDVEGFESKVYKSVSQLLDTDRLLNIVLEYNQGIAEASSTKTKEYLALLEENPRMLADILNKGFRMGLMLDGVAKTSPYGGSRTLPPLPEVTRDVVWYDLQDAAMFRNITTAHWEGRQAPHGFNCPVIEELRTVNSPSWGTCIVMPHHAHPKSLRSSFPFNTNLWATKQLQLVKFSGSPGVLPQTADLTQTYFVSDSIGAGGYSCPHVPPYMLVAIRCPCSWLENRPEPVNDTDVIEKCGKETDLVFKYIKDGTLSWKEPWHKPATASV